MTPKRELVFRTTIDDCDVQHSRSGGKGGQNQNKRDTGTRVRHVPSGAVGESREHKSQLQNKRAAFRRMAESPAFQAWARVMALKIPPVEVVVDEQMAPENLIVESRVNGRWQVEVA